MTVDPSLLLNRIALRVRKRRLELGLTQTELAARMGITQGNITRIENNPPNLSIETICKLAEALGMEAEDLLVEKPGRDDEEG